MLVVLDGRERPHRPGGSAQSRSSSSPVRRLLRLVGGRRVRRPRPARARSLGATPGTRRGCQICSVVRSGAGIVDPGLDAVRVARSSRPGWPAVFASVPAPSVRRDWPGGSGRGRRWPARRRPAGWCGTRRTRRTRNSSWPRRTGRRRPAPAAADRPARRRTPPAARPRRRSAMLRVLEPAELGALARGARPPRRPGGPACWCRRGGGPACRAAPAPRSCGSRRPT